MSNRISFGRIIVYFTYILVSLSGLLLVARVILRFLAANASAPFVMWVYETTDVLLYPFKGIFPTTSLGQLFVIDFSALFAIAIYGVLAYLIENLISNLESRK